MESQSFGEKLEKGVKGFLKFLFVLGIGIAAGMEIAEHCFDVSGAVGGIVNNPGFSPAEELGEEVWSGVEGILPVGAAA